MPQRVKHNIQARVNSDIACSARGSVRLPQNTFDKLDNKFRKIGESFSELFSICYSGLAVKGRAICSKEDKFNPKTGMKIATLKAKLSGTNRLLKRIQSLEKAIDEIRCAAFSAKLDVVNEQVDLEHKLSELAG